MLIELACLPSIKVVTCETLGGRVAGFSRRSRRCVGHGQSAFLIQSGLTRSLCTRSYTNFKVRVRLAGSFNRPQIQKTGPWFRPRTELVLVLIVIFLPFLGVGHILDIIILWLFSKRLLGHPF